MNLYLLTQNERASYNTYDAIVVCAENEEEARNILPDDYLTWEDTFEEWCSSPNMVYVKYLGTADNKVKKGVVLASFNAV